MTELEDGRRPLPVGRVVTEVMHLLWRNDTESQCDFVIAGSYPAAVKAWERKGVILPYNDIDVFVVQEQRADRENFFVDTRREEVIIMGQTIDINITTLGWWQIDLVRLINEFDINAIMIGLIIKPSSVSGNTWMLEWHEDPSYDRFLSTLELQLVDIGRLQYPASAFVRLLRKAKQLRPLGISYSVPEASVLLQTLNHRFIREVTKKKLDSLGADYNQEVYRRFNLKRVYWRSKGLWLFCFVPYGSFPSKIYFEVDPYEMSFLPRTSVDVFPDSEIVSSSDESSFTVDPYSETLLSISIDKVLSHR